jgi:ElaB/YqjD/DUF883 family membrane-anchored ribosome-binding protein
MSESSNEQPLTSGESMRDTAERAAYDVKERLASTLGNVAGKTRQVAANAPGAVSNLADEAAERFGHASDYVRDLDPKDVWADVQKFVKARPAESLAAAIAVGFLVGRLAARRV